MKLARFQRPKKKISSGFRPNVPGKLAIVKNGSICNQKGAFGG
jgi:hypothetical protein